MVCAAWLFAPLVPAAAAELRPVKVKTSLLGTHRWFAQTHRGIEVLGGFVARHEYRNGRTSTVEGRRLVRGDVDRAPAVSRERAAAVARAARGLARVARQPTLAILPGQPARLVWKVVVERSTGPERVLVDAVNEAVVRVDRLAVDATGSGRVFDPNPVVALRDTTLADRDDADHASFADAYEDVSLTALDGSGLLRGDYARIALPADDAAFSSDLGFRFGRSSGFFEQVMSYYHVTRAQEEIQRLGFADINNEPQALLPNAIAADQSFYDAFADVIVFGTGGVDDAEDADIIWHEYGHAIQFDQFYDELFGQTSDMAAIGEGFSDYWAVTMSQPVNDGYDVPCVGDWDALGFPSAPRCLRRVDGDRTVDERTGQQHADGEIWSRALWDVNQALGRDITNRIVLEAQFAYSPLMTFAEAASVTVATAQLLYDRAAARAVQRAFEDRGIRVVRPDHPPHPERPPHPIDSQTVLAADVLAAIGAAAPAGGTLAGDFELGGLNAAGAASFNVDLHVDGQAIGEGALLYDGRRLLELARAGDRAPGGGQFALGTLGQVALNDRADVAFGFLLDPPDEPFGVNAGLFLAPGSGASLRALVLPDRTPAPTGGFFRGAFEAALDGRGGVAFTGLAQTDAGYLPDIGSGVYVMAADGAITRIAAPGDRAPSGGTFDHAAGAAVNGAGDVAFTAHVSGDPTPCDEGFLDCFGGVYLRRASTRGVEAVAAHGGPAPGAPGSTFEFGLEPVLNERGDVLFFGLAAPDLDEGLFLRTPAGTQLAVRSFEEVPGVGVIIPAFPFFRGFAPDYALGNSGQITFRAFVLDPETDGFLGAFLLRRDSHGTRVLAAPGTEVPGVGTIRRLLTGVLLNDRGQLLLQALLQDGRRVVLRTR